MKVRRKGTRVSAPAVCAAVAAALGGRAADAGAAQLPVPCIAGSCGSSVRGWVSSGNATASTSGNTMQIQQGSNNAVLNWSSFNVSADGKVVFQQPSSTSVAINKIYQESPSAIFGTVTANGQLYLLNPNGVIFGSTARVNVAGLVASSLQISSDAETKGILDPISTYNAAFTNPDGRSSVTDLQGNVVLGPDGQPQPVVVSVQSGAQITAASGGRILLAGSGSSGAKGGVQNAGTIQAPDGQIILAAGDKLYLQSSSDPSLRGLVVEVDGGGTAANQLNGLLSSPRGNISMVGLAVNQDGRISATTTVSSNGSVTLVAADTVTNNPAGTTPGVTPQKGGTLTLGPGSEIDVLPELNDTTTEVDAQKQQQSNIVLTGQQVFMQGATIVAPAANLTVTAQSDPTGIPNGSTAAPSDARIRIDSTTTIDLSGSTAELPVSANIVSAQLRANELANDPTQRNGVLYKQTVYVDARADNGYGTPIADVSGQLQAVPKNIAQRTETGGTATFVSEGDIVLAAGASINVSGGQTRYDGGYVQTTQLIGANGKTYDIGSANPLLTYVGVINPTFSQTYNQWGTQTVVPTSIGHYESGYVQGASAGTVTFAAPAMALNGSLVGHAVDGPYQRSPSVTDSAGNSTYAKGGTLVIGLAGGLNGTTGNTIDYLAPGVNFVSAAPQLSISDDARLPVTGAVNLPVDYLESGGFTQTQIYSNLSVTVPQGLSINMLPGSSLLASAPNINIFGNITALSGSLDLESTVSVLNNTDTPRLGIQIGDGVTLDVRGQWTNDWLNIGNRSALGPTLQDGGSIKMNLTNADADAQLALGNDVSLRASGGAWVRSDGSIVGGKGGQIQLLADTQSTETSYGIALQVGNHVSLDGYGVGSAAGGSFTLNAPRLQIAQGTTDWTHAQQVDESAKPGGVFEVDAPLFSSFGFSSVNLIASDPILVSPSAPDILSVQPGTQIQARAASLQLSKNYLQQPGGGVVDGFASVQTLPPYQRGPVSVSLAALPVGQGYGKGNSPGQVSVGTGALISTDPGGSIMLEGTGSIHVDGTLSARGGNITLHITSPEAVVPTAGQASPDEGFLADQRIDLGPTAVLDASGTSVLTPNDSHLLLGSVLPGGSVSLDAERGAVVAHQGSVIDVSGTSALLDVASSTATNGYVRERVASAGGSISVLAPESISLLGSLHAAAGQGDTGPVPAGSLSIELDRRQFSSPTGLLSTYPSAPRLIEVVSDTSGNSPYSSDSGLAVIGVNQLMASGIDSLSLTSDRIDFATSAPLQFARQVSLDAPVISVANGIHAGVSAPYVSIGYTGAASTLSPTSGTGVFTASASEFMELVGSTVFQGIQSATLSSVADLQLRGTLPGQPDPTKLTGALSLQGNLELDAARIYPATNTQFTFNAVAPSSSGTGSGTATPESTVIIRPPRVASASATQDTPLSAGGSITIDAGNIEVGDPSGSATPAVTALMAPFGQIELNATDSLRLEPGATLSVSAGSQEILYGSTQLGQQEWTYNGSTVSGIPNRQITINGSSVNFAQGATIDLSGGGDLYAYEWVPGSGGTKDALAPNSPVPGLALPSGTAPALYAVFPSMVNQFAPYDPQEFTGSSLQPGQSVYLSGIPGLPAGVYPLLPARYALLPGAFLIQQEPGFSGINPSREASLGDGTPVVAGYRTFGNTGLGDPLYSGFAVYPGSFGRQLAQYDDSFASTFFAAQASKAGNPVPNLPADAGRLAISVSASLDVAGTVLSSAATGGRSAEIDISGTNLEVFGSSPQENGAVQISASTLTSWHAGELLIGGQTQSDGSINVSANTVTVDSDAQLTADEIVLVGSQSVNVQSGALASTSANTSSAIPKTLLKPTSVSLSDSGAAFVSVSDQALLVPDRTAGATGSSGSIQIGSAATLSSRGALVADAPGTVEIDGSMTGTGAAWSLASSSVSFGTGGSSKDSLVIGSGLLGSLQQAGGVRIASASSIDLWMSNGVTLGTGTGSSSPSLQYLTLIGSSLNNFVPGEANSFGANKLTLQGLAQPAAVPTSAPSNGGTLTLTAGELDVGPGSLTTTGFGQVNATASIGLVGQGTGSVTADGNLSLTAPVITAAGGANTTIAAPNGTLQLQSTSASATLPTYLGGSLALSAANIDDSGTVAVRSGLINLSATNNLSLGANAVLDASGLPVSNGEATVGSPGGAITLKAGGDLTLASGSNVSVSGALNAPAGEGASAGQIALQGTGTVTANATFTGQAVAGQTGGSFSLDAGQLSAGTTLTSLANSLAAGGFTNSIGVRARSGDLALGSTGAITSNQVRITADTGLVDIYGQISAPGAGQRGQIGLFGGKGVTLESSAQLHADSSNASQPAGSIEIGTTTLSGGTVGVISLDQGSKITGGQLLVRAPLVNNNTDMSVSTMAADMTGVGQVILEPVLSQNVGSSLGASDYAGFNTTLQGIMGTAAPTILARLNPGSASNVTVQAGLELQSTSDLTLNDPLNLGDGTWRFSGQPIDLTIRAGGSLNVNGSISDGFDTSGTALALLAGPSSSLRLVAGADLTSADPLAVTSSSTADLTLAPGVVVRTGTGELDLIAAHDVNVGAGSSAYTAGYAAIPSISVKGGKGIVGHPIFNFPTDGGRLLVSAGNDVNGSPVQQAVTDWMLRQGNQTHAAQWGVELDQFGWNFGTLGGGDLSVIAGHDITTISAATANSLIAATATSPALQLHGGGLNVQAANNITSSQFYVSEGKATLTAGGSFDTSTIPGYTLPVGSLLSMGDAQISIQARQDVNLEGIINPTVFSQQAGSANSSIGGQYYTYGEDSAVHVSSTSGTIFSEETLDPFIDQAVKNGTVTYYQIALPASISMKALSQDIVFKNNSQNIMFPSDSGQLELFASKNIVGSNVVGSGTLITMSDQYASLVPTPELMGQGVIGSLLLNSSLNVVNSGISDRHLNDPNPIMVSAGTDISELTLVMPKATEVMAGRDLVDVSMIGQNLRPTDVTVESAGRDITNPAVSATGTQFGGPGRVDVLAGRDISLGLSQGIVSFGNTENPNLPNGGADLNVLAGLGQSPDVAGFVSKIVAASPADQQMFINAVEGQTGATDLTYAQAQTKFGNLSSDIQRDITMPIFFSELNQSGIDHNTIRTAGYTRGYAAIDAMFPGSRTATDNGQPSPYQGDLSLTLSRIYTLGGGNISIDVPGGKLDVGLANPPASIGNSKGPDQLGIVAEGPGDVDIFTKNDVNVNNSRIFTLGGGNILIWSNEGNIDAGRGAKTSVSAPPPQITTDSNGNIRLNFGGAVAGSGIRTIQTGPTIPPGNVTLVAPVGTVNAGDAGIGSSGNLTLAAAHVLGTDNIQVAGTSSGVPPQIGNLSASLSSAASAASGTTNSSTNSAVNGSESKETAAPTAAAALSWLDVYVEGFGAELCKPEDLECLKRNQKP